MASQSSLTHRHQFTSAVPASRMRRRVSPTSETTTSICLPLIEALVAIFSPLGDSLGYWKTAKLIEAFVQHYDDGEFAAAADSAKAAAAAVGVMQ